MEKRGISEVVTSVLIILLSLAAIILLWYFLSSFLNDSLGDVEVGALSSSLKIVEESVKINRNIPVVRFLVSRNAGNAEIVGYGIVLEDLDKQTFTKNYASQIKQFETEEVIIRGGDVPQGHNFDLSRLKKISIYAIVSSEGDKNVSSGIQSEFSLQFFSGEVDECGDGEIDEGEVCDSANLNGESCLTRGFDGGILSCNDFCDSFVTSSCESYSENYLVAKLDFQSVDNLVVQDSASEGSSDDDASLKGNADLLPGKVGNSLNLDGDGDYAEIADSADVRSQDYFSISAWAQIEEDLTGTNVIVHKDGEYNISLYGDLLSMNLYSDPTLRPNCEVTQTAAYPSDGAWHNVVMVVSLLPYPITYGGENYYYEILGYIDGEIEVVAYCKRTSLTNPLSDSLTVGGKSDGGYIMGKIDEFLFYERPLNEEDINIINSV